MTSNINIPDGILHDHKTNLHEETEKWFEHYAYEKGINIYEAEHLAEQDYLLRIYMTGKKCTLFLTLIQNPN